MEFNQINVKGKNIFFLSVLREESIITPLIMHVICHIVILMVP